MVAVHQEQGLVGCAIYDDSPSVPGNVAQAKEDEAPKWAIQSALDLGYMVGSNLFATLFLLSHNVLSTLSNLTNG